MSFLKSMYKRVNVNSVRLLFYSIILQSALSGASDVIVVKNKDGTYLCSLFRVRFGKMSVSCYYLFISEQIVSKAKGKRMVSIRVNSIPVEQKMRVGSDGEAYFLSELYGDDINECPSPICISPSSSLIVSKILILFIQQNMQDERSPSPPPPQQGFDGNDHAGSPRKTNSYSFNYYCYICLYYIKFYE